MQTVLAVITLVISVVLIASVLLQEGSDAGMGSAIAGGIDKLFGKGAAKGVQALLQRITVISGVAFMVMVFIMGALFR